MPVTMLTAEAVACHSKAARRMRREGYFCRGVRRDFEPDVIPVNVQLRRLIRRPDHLDKLSLGDPDDVIPDNRAVRDSNLDPCLRICLILFLLRGSRT